MTGDRTRGLVKRSKKEDDDIVPAMRGRCAVGEEEDAEEEDSLHH
jgi:hypothetical protein